MSALSGAWPWVWPGVLLGCGLRLNPAQVTITNPQPGRPWSVDHSLELGDLRGCVERTAHVVRALSAYQLLPSAAWLRDPPTSCDTAAASCVGPPADTASQLPAPTCSCLLCTPGEPERCQHRYVPPAILTLVFQLLPVVAPPLTLLDACFCLLCAPGEPEPEL